MKVVRDIAPIPRTFTVTEGQKRDSFGQKGSCRAAFCKLFYPCVFFCLLIEIAVNGCCLVQNVRLLSGKAFSSIEKKDTNCSEMLKS